MFTYCLGLLAHVTWPRLYIHWNRSTDKQPVFNTYMKTNTVHSFSKVWLLILMTILNIQPALWLNFSVKAARRPLHTCSCHCYLSQTQEHNYWPHLFVGSYILHLHNLYHLCTSFPAVLLPVNKTFKHSSSKVSVYVGTYSIMLLCGVLINTLCRHQWAM